MSEADVIHIFVSQDEYGWYLQSPQLPSLVFGRPTQTEFFRDYRAVLAAAGAHGTVVAHWDNRYETPEEAQYVVRACADEDRGKDERVETLNRLLGVMTTDQRFHLLEDAQANLVGDVVFVMALPVDRLSFFMGQLDPRGDAFTLVVNVAEGMVFTTQIASHGRLDLPDGWNTLEAMGFDQDSTVSELMQRLDTAKPAERALVVA